MLEFQAFRLMEGHQLETAFLVLVWPAACESRMVEELMRVVEAAGLDPDEVVRHTLRHTAITHLVQSGVDLPTVMRISGHKTLIMVARYAHQNGAHIQAAMDKLEKRLECG